MDYSCSIEIERTYINLDEFESEAEAKVGGRLSIPLIVRVIVIVTRHSMHLHVLCQTDSVHVSSFLSFSFSFILHILLASALVQSPFAISLNVNSRSFVIVLSFSFLVYIVFCKISHT